MILAGISLIVFAMMMEGYGGFEVTEVAAAFWCGVALLVAGVIL